MAEKIVKIRLEDLPEDLRKKVESNTLDNYDRINKSFSEISEKAMNEWEMDQEGT